MAAGWSVASAAALGATVALALVGLPQGMGFGFRAIVLLALLGAAIAAWALALAQSAHGSRGAVVALAGYALGAALAPGLFLLARCSTGQCPPAPWAAGAAATILGALGALAAIGEARRRRGKVQWGSAVALLAPLALVLAWTAATW